jgi:phenylacetate-CoA ligase
MSRRLWNEEAETMPAAELRALQLAKLQRHVARLDAESPYYRAKFRAAGVNPIRLRTLEEFADYPMFDKDEERQSQERSAQELGHPFGMHLVCDPAKVVRVSASSGTTGSPTFQGYSQKDRDVSNEVGARVLWRTGLRPGRVAFHCFELSMWIAGIPPLDVLQAFGATAVPVGARTGAARLAQLAQLLRPERISLTPSYAEYLIRKIPEEAGISAADLGVRALSLGGEPGGGTPETRDRLSAGFGGAEIFDNIGATGASFMSSVSCPENAGMHFVAPDYILLEVLDSQTKRPLPLEDGVIGELVFTGLEKEAGPLLRWQEKDLVEVFVSPCGCGLPGMRYRILGRADDMLLVRGVNVFPHAVKDLVSGFGSSVTGQVRIVLQAPPPVAASPLPIRVELSAGISAEEGGRLAGQIAERIHDILRFRAAVEPVEFGALSGDVGNNDKAKVFDRRY